MSPCQKELSDSSAEKQIFDLASLLWYLSAAVANLSVSPSFHVFFFCVCVCVCAAAQIFVMNSVQQSVKTYAMAAYQGGIKK